LLIVPREGDGAYSVGHLQVHRAPPPRQRVRAMR
jgi:hypothetical protein